MAILELKNGFDVKSKIDILVVAKNVASAPAVILRHRCSHCDFQTSFRGKLSTHLISKHSDLRRDKKKLWLSEKKREDVTLVVASQ